MTRPPGPPLEQMTATEKMFDFKSYGNKTAIAGTEFKLMLHMIVRLQEKAV